MKLKYFLFFIVKYPIFQFEYSDVIDKIVENDGKIFVTHGFLGSKTIEIFKNIVKISKKEGLNRDEQNIRFLYISGFCWNLAKFNFKLQLNYKKHNITFNIKPFYYDYDNYFIPIGCMDAYPGPECIFRRIGFFLVSSGIEFNYNESEFHKFSFNISGGINVIGKKYIPLDLIFSFSPFIYQNYKKFYIELNTSFSIGEFIKKILIANMDYQKFYSHNWDMESFDSAGSDHRKLLNHFIKKNENLRNGNISKAKFILVDGLLWSMIYNTRLYLGIRIL